MYIRTDDNGFIVTWGEAELPASIHIVNPPEDYRENAFLKYRWDGTELVVREDYVEFIPEPETPADSEEPETPADPE
jgi:hypothetical protein